MDHIWDTLFQSFDECMPPTTTTTTTTKKTKILKDPVLSNFRLFEDGISLGQKFTRSSKIKSPQSKLSRCHSQTNPKSSTKWDPYLKRLSQHTFGTHTPKTFTKKLNMDFFHNSWLGGLPGVCWNNLRLPNISRVPLNPLIRVKKTQVSIDFGPIYRGSFLTSFHLNRSGPKADLVKRKYTPEIFHIDTWGTPRPTIYTWMEMVKQPCSI